MTHFSHFYFLDFFIGCGIIQDMKGYGKSIVCAGGKIHCSKRFGSYQGDWWAKVTYKDQTGWICVKFGSCTTCDDYKAEFNPFDKPPTKTELAAFGKKYLDGCIMTQEEAIKKASKDLDWDLEAQPMVDFIKENG